MREVHALHSSVVTGVARRILEDASAAEDVAQRVFMRLWERPERYTPSRGSLRSFLCADAQGRSLDHRRSDRSRMKRETAERVRLEPYDDDTIRAVDHRLRADRIRQGVAALPALERDAITLAYFHHLSYREVARALDAPEGTIKSRIRSGLLRLRNELVDLDDQQQALAG